MLFFFFCRQKAAYEMLISDWSSDVCSSYLLCGAPQVAGQKFSRPLPRHLVRLTQHRRRMDGRERVCCERRVDRPAVVDGDADAAPEQRLRGGRAKTDQQIGRASCRERVWQYV